MSALERLQHWYPSQCDGDWEHYSNFSLEPLDNPGWIIKLRIFDNDLEQVAVIDLMEERSEHDWIAVRKTKDQLRIACGPLNLTEALQRFLDIVEPIHGRGASDPRFVGLKITGSDGI